MKRDHLSQKVRSRFLAPSEGQKGTTILEFALVAMAFFLLTLGLMDISRAVWAYHSLSYGAREGARYAIVHGNRSNSPATAAIVESTVQGQIPNLQGVTVTTTWNPNNAQASTVEVQAEYTFQPIMPVFNFTIPLTATSRMAVSY